MKANEVIFSESDSAIGEDSGSEAPTEKQDEEAVEEDDDLATIKAKTM